MSAYQYRDMIYAEEHHSYAACFATARQNGVSEDDAEMCQDGECECPGCPLISKGNPERGVVTIPF